MYLSFIQSPAKATGIRAYRAWLHLWKYGLPFHWHRVGWGAEAGSHAGGQGTGATESSHEPWRAISWTLLKDEKAEQKQEMKEESPLKMKKFLKATIRSFLLTSSSIGPQEVQYRALTRTHMCAATKLATANTDTYACSLWPPGCNETHGQLSLPGATTRSCWYGHSSILIKDKDRGRLQGQ